MKKSNKGFSLVELIIVIAIMAILIAVLAPQYLKYVEKTKRTTDASAFGEMVKATEAAIADPTVNTLTADKFILSWDGSTGAITVTDGTNTATAIQNETNLSATGVTSGTVKAKSKLFRASSTCKFEITGSGDNWTKSYGGAIKTYNPNL